MCRERIGETGVRLSITLAAVVDCVSCSSRAAVVPALPPPSRVRPGPELPPARRGGTSGGAVPDRSFRALTWNIYLRNTEDPRLTEIAAAIAAARADIVLFQEVPRPIAATTAAQDEIYLEKIRTKLEAASGRAWTPSPLRAAIPCP